MKQGICLSLVDTEKALEGDNMLHEINRLHEEIESLVEGKPTKLAEAPMVNYSAWEKLVIAIGLFPEAPEGGRGRSP